MRFSAALQNLQKTHRYRVRKILESATGVEIVIDKKPLINFCSNDYLGLAHHPKIKAAFKKGAAQYGAGAGAAHFLSGHFKAHAELEERLADFTGQQKALIFSTGYMANLGVFQALENVVDWVVQDRRNHASMMDANRLIKKPIRRYRHKNTDALEKKINGLNGAGLVATEHIFSMDGDRAPIRKIAKIAQKSGALLMQDDAHGFGVFPSDIPDHSIYMATLGKAVGTFGAFVAGDADFVDFLSQHARTYIYTTAPPPAICAATMESLNLIQSDEYVEKLRTNIDFFRTTAADLKIPFLPSESAIFPLVIGENQKTLVLAKKLYDRGFFVRAIRPPTVPENSARLRVSLSAAHTKMQIEKLLLSIKNALA